MLEVRGAGPVCRQEHQGGDEQDPGDPRRVARQRARQRGGRGDDRPHRTEDRRRLGPVRRGLQPPGGCLDQRWQRQQQHHEHHGQADDAVARRSADAGTPSWLRGTGRRARCEGAPDPSGRHPHDDRDERQPDPDRRRPDGLRRHALRVVVPVAGDHAGLEQPRQRLDREPQGHEQHDGVEDQPQHKGRDHSRHVAARGSRPRRRGSWRAGSRDGWSASRSRARLRSRRPHTDRAGGVASRRGEGCRRTHLAHSSAAGCCAASSAPR